MEGFDDIRFVDCETAKFGASCSVKVLRSRELDFLVFADKFQYQLIDAGKGNEVEMPRNRKWSGAFMLLLCPSPYLGRCGLMA